MANDNELLIRINGNAKDFISELDKARARTKALQDTLAKTAKISAAAFVALAGAVGLAVRAFSQFEKTFTDVVTLLDKGSFSTKTLKQGIDDLAKGVLALGSSSGESLENLNKGLFDIISATGDAENAMGVLEAATQLAIAGGTDVSIAVDGITTAIKAFGLETSDAQVVAEKFFQAQKGGKTTVDQLATSIGIVAATANAYNVSLDELLAASSAATLAGNKTNATFTGLKAVFAGVAKPTEDAAKEAKRLGIEFNSTALRAQGLKGFLDSLTTANGFTQQSIEKLFGSQEAQGVLFALTGEQAGDFTKQLELLNDQQDAAATFADALAVKQATTERALARLGTSTKAAAVVFGEVFAPTIIAAADALAEIAKSFSELDKETLGTIASITKFFLALFAGVATIATVGFSLLRIQALLAALKVAFATTAISARVMWSSITLGATLIIGFLPEIISGFKELFGVINKAADLKTLVDINERIKDINTELEETQKQFGKGGLSVRAADIQKIKQLQDELDTLINKRKELQDQETVADADAASKAAAKEKAKQDAIAAERAAARELDLEFQREFNELSAEERATFDDSEKQAFLDNLQSREQVRNDVIKESVVKEIQDRNDKLKREEKNRKVFEKIGLANAAKEITFAEDTANKLTFLARSKNKELAAIGKAASIISITIDTARGAIAAYSSLAGIPFVGPALGIAAAAGVISFGAEQISQVNSAQQGGFIPGAGSRDRNITLTEPGEIIIPKAISPNFISQFGRGSDGGVDEEANASEVTIGFTDDAFEIIEQKFLERRAIGIGSL